MNARGGTAFNRYEVEWSWMPRNFSARRRKTHPRRVCSPAANFRQLALPFDDVCSSASLLGSEEPTLSDFKKGSSLLSVEWNFEFAGDQIEDGEEVWGCAVAAGFAFGR